MLFFSWLAAGVMGQSTLQQSIDNFAQDKALRHSGISIAVLDIKTGKVIAQYDKDRSLTPASILKILTTSTSLAILGGEYRFKTTLDYSGYIDKQGTLNGNLFITGYGDPTLGSHRWSGLTSDVDELAKGIFNKGVRCIEGSIVGDGSYFDSAVNAPGWQWEDLGNYYAAGAWGLNINENQYKLSFAQTAKEGAQPRITGIYPEINDLAFVNELTSGARGSGDNAYIYGAPYSYTRFVRGTIPAGNGTFTIKGSIPDAPLFAANYFAKALEKEGITATKGIFSHLFYPGEIPARSSRKNLYTHYSPTLKKIVKETNLKSVNLFCEAMLKTVGIQGALQGNTARGLARQESYWKDRGLSFEGIGIVDGSGLSRRNSISANFMVQLLRKISLNKAIYPDLYPSLSIAGKTGYVKSILRNTRAEGNLRAKTGTMEGVRSFAGYATMKNGKKVSFCIIVNNFEGTGKDIRQKCAKVMQAICE